MNPVKRLGNFCHPKWEVLSWEEVKSAHSPPLPRHPLLSVLSHRLCSSTLEMMASALRLMQGLCLNYSPGLSLSFLSFGSHSAQGRVVGMVGMAVEWTIALYLLKFYLSARARVEQTKREVMSIEELNLSRVGCGKQALPLQGWDIAKMEKGSPSLPLCRNSPTANLFG